MTDSKGGYPQDLQAKLYSEFLYKGIRTIKAKYRRTETEVVESPNQTNTATNEDHVIALKLDKWPRLITDNLVAKMTDSCFQVRKVTII